MLRRSAADDRGAVLVIVALMLPLIMMLLVFAVDTGNWWVHKRHLQTQADAAALAGGGRFGDCFTMATATAVSNMQDEANKYAGLNVWTGANKAVSNPVLYNSETYADQSSPADPTTSPDPCTPWQTPPDPKYLNSMMFDAKATEEGLPTLFGILPSLFSGFESVDYINATARVELFQIQVGKPSMPLAVPDITPEHVSVTFVNQTRPNQPSLIAGPFDLTRGDFVNGIRYWSGTVSIDMPSGYSNVGMRVGIGNDSGDCFNSFGDSNDPPQYVCYDNVDKQSSLVLIHGYKGSDTGTADAPAARDVWETLSDCGVNSGTPFFTSLTNFTRGGNASCQAWIQARIDFGGSTPPGARVFDINSGTELHLVSGDTWAGQWTVGAGGGRAEQVKLGWMTAAKCSVSHLCAFSTPPEVQQQVYSGDSVFGASGPIEYISLAGGSSSGPGAPYSLPDINPSTHTRTQTLTVTVGLQGDYEELALPSPLTLLRLQIGGSSSLSTAVVCDPPGAGDPGGNESFKLALQYGCHTPYQLNLSRVCPDPSIPAGEPADCVPVKTGSLGNTVGASLNARYSTCPANNWDAISPDPAHLVNEKDPRMVLLMITDFTSLLGNPGMREVPVTNYGYFYITGWEGSTCGNNEAPPVPVKNNDGSIWGHFLKYADPSEVASSRKCFDPNHPNNIIPCVPALTR